MHDLRNDLFAAFQKMPLGFFQEQTGPAFSRMISDVESSRRGFQWVLFIGQELLQLAGCIALMLHYNSVLSLVLLIAAAPFLLLSETLLPPENPSLLKGRGGQLQSAHRHSRRIRPRHPGYSRITRARLTRKSATDAALQLLPPITLRSPLNPLSTSPWSLSSGKSS